MCGVRITFGSEASGDTLPWPSATWTSSAAPAGRSPSLSAASSAASSTTPPLAMFTRKLPGFMAASSAAPMRPRVSGPSGTWMLTKSLRSRTSVIETSAMPCSANRPARSALGLSTQPMTVIPQPRPSRATVLPIDPMPTMPSVLPPRFQPTTSFLAQWPDRSSRSTSTTWRARPRNSAKVSSATAIAFLPGQFET